MEKARHNTSKKRKKTWFKPPFREDFIKRVDFAQAYKASHAMRLEVEIFGGNVILLPATDKIFRCRMQWHHQAEANQQIMPQMMCEGEVIKIHQKSGFSSFIRYKQRNAYVMVLEVPSHLSLNIKMRAGQLYVDKITNPILSLKVNVGSIDGFAFTRKTYVSLDVGSIKLHGLRGSAHVRVRLGDIEATFDQVNRGDQLMLSTTAGDVKLRLPASLLLQNSPITKNGDIENKSGAHIYVHAGLWGGTYVESC